MLQNVFDAPARGTLPGEWATLLSLISTERNNFRMIDMRNGFKSALLSLN